MATSPLGSLPSFANIPQPTPVNPLQALLGGFQQGIGLAQLPQQMEQQALNDQLALALKQAQVEAIPFQRAQQEKALRDLIAQSDPNFAANQRASEIQFAVDKARALGQLERELSVPAAVPLKFTETDTEIIAQDPFSGVVKNTIKKVPGARYQTTPNGVMVFTDPANPTKGTIAPGSEPIIPPSGGQAEPVYDEKGNLLGYGNLPKNFKSAKDLAPESAKIDKPTAVDVTFSTNIDSFKRHADQLKEIVTNFGGYEGGIPLLSNPDATAALEALPYAMAIEYAKLKDPDSVAREGEVAAAKKYLIPIGSTVRNSVTLAAIERQIKDIEQLRQSRAKAKGGTLSTPENAPVQPAGSISLPSGNSFSPAK